MIDFIDYPDDYGHRLIEDKEIPVRDCFHIFTRGMGEDSFYKSDELFRKVFNSTGIILLHHRVRLLGFNQMGNHSHFTAQGPRHACEDFIMTFAIRVAQHAAYTKEGGLLSKIQYGIEPIEDLEYLLTCLTYGDKNPLSAGARHLPTDYPWGSAGLMFRKEGTLPPKEARPLGILGAREQKKRFNTNERLPQDWLFLPGDLLWPGNYIDYRTSQELFRNSPARYFYYLSKNQKARVQMGMRPSITLTDQEARNKLAEISLNLYNTDNISTLDPNRRVQVAIKAKSTWNIPAKQSARLLHLPADALKDILA
ncbi:MAG: hypothetical protein IJ603_08155 [Bacteroidales bacterium]|nr:hypothetical protein [Bacteroidales bacterium]